MNPPCTPSNGRTDAYTPNPGAMAMALHGHDLCHSPAMATQSCGHGTLLVGSTVETGFAKPYGCSVKYAKD